MKMHYTNITTKIIILACLLCCLVGCSSPYEDFVKRVNSEKNRGQDEKVVSTLTSLLTQLKESDNYRVRIASQGSGWGSRIEIRGCVRLSKQADVFSDPHASLVIDTSREGLAWSPEKGTVGVVWVSGKGFMVDHEAEIITMMGFE